MHSYEVALDNWWVPAENLIGGEGGLGQGFYLQMAGFENGRLQTAARAIGVMQAAYEAARVKGVDELALCFDLAAMASAGVVATNTPDVLTETTADFGFALMMATARRITEGEADLRAGRWTTWRYDLLAGADIHGATLGILGMGRIGQGIARRGALGFGMTVIYHNRSRLSAELELHCQARYVSKQALLQTADHLVLVLPYAAESHHAIGAAELAQMKPTATLVNIARGGIVDDAALAAALKSGQIAAAGLDVFEGEPAIHPDLLDLSNVVLTPHIASASLATRLAMANLAADNLLAFFSGQSVLTPVSVAPAATA